MMPEKEGSVENCILTSRTEDEIDYPPNEYIYRRRDVIFVLIGAFTLLLDWGFDIWTAYKHWSHNDIGWFILTVLFICASSLIINGVSLYWYVTADPSEGNPNASKCTWTLRYILIILQLGPLLRYYDTLHYGLRSRAHWKRGEEQQQKRLYTQMLYEDGDSGFLRMFECFIEAAPQLVLQLYTLTQVTEVDDPKYGKMWQYFQMMTSLVSLVSLSWGVTAYARCSRFTNTDKDNISVLGSITIFLWHFFCLCARVTALVVFASHFQVVVVWVCLGHWLLMVFYLLPYRMFGPENRRCCTCYEMLMKLFLGLVYIFVFLNNKDEKTRWKYTAYYIVWELENIVLIVLFLWYGDPHTSYYVNSVVFHAVSFALGLTFMGIYYSLLHPTRSPHPPLLPIDNSVQQQQQQQQQQQPQLQQPQQQQQQQQQQLPSPQSHTNQLRQTEL